MPRLYVPTALSAGLALSLPTGAARHVQVLRLQPGAPLTLFNDAGGEWAATVTRMGRSEVDVLVGAHDATERELPVRVTLAVGMPANERMDWLVEKATELGVDAVQPLVCERSVLRLSGERAEKKRGHWQGVAAAASEQSGRTRVPRIEAVLSLGEWLRALPEPAGASPRHVLSLGDGVALRDALVTVSEGNAAPLFLSGPEGGLSPAEEAAALARGFRRLSLGARVLRADTAPLTVMAAVAVAAG